MVTKKQRIVIHFTHNIGNTYRKIVNSKDIINNDTFILMDTLLLRPKVEIIQKLFSDKMIFLR